MKILCFRAKIWSYLIVAMVSAALIGVDLATTLDKNTSVNAIPVSQLKQDGLPPGYSTQVAYIRSDNSKLTKPAGLNVEITREQILEMVYQALDLDGNLKPLLFPNAKITIKPNIVELGPEGNGVNTDARVVEGLIRWMEKQLPGQLKYTVAEAAGGWINETMRNTPHNRGGAPMADGFTVTGYTAMIQRLAADGIQAQMVDANFGTPEEPYKGIRLAPVPEWRDFPEYPAYWVHEAILDPDILINVPVMKIHTPNITVCLKNYIGIAAGAKYGCSKERGSVEGDVPGLHQDWPAHNSVNIELLDLATLAPADYNLVDAIVCKERAKTETDPSVRRNMVIAGKDMVAVDAVCTRLMGLNPDNVPHLVEAAREGMGTIDPQQITILGEGNFEDSIYYFERSPENFQGNRGHFGMSPRIWLLNSVTGDAINTPYLGTPDEQVTAQPGTGGWTEPIFFSDDYIDFEAFYGTENGKVYYAFCWVTVPEEQDAEIWFTCDEPAAVWIGGVKVYQSNKTYTKPAMPGGAAATIHLLKGRQPVLVKLVDKTSTAPFVFNLCRILPSELSAGKATYPNLKIRTNYKKYEGTRILGLKFDAGIQSGVAHWRNY